MTTRQRAFWLPALLSAVLVRGCSCDDGLGQVEHRDWVCSDEGRRPELEDGPCVDGERFVKGICDVARCDASTLASNCCPGMYCTGGGECVVPPSRITTCTQDSACSSVPGQRCLARPNVSASSTCGFLPVDANGSCPTGLQGFNQRCIVNAPCDGACAAGQVCNIDTHKCETAPSLAGNDHGCDQVCGASKILVYSDPDNMLFDQCCEVRCECATLPPLLPGNWGRYSDIALRDGALLVSAYDGGYGDLVVAELDLQTGTNAGFDYVDGLPEEGGAVVADPSGPRGGIAEPGPDVGPYTSMVASAGPVYIAYYDVDARALKLAIRDGDTWSTSTIDRDGDALDDNNDSGDVGAYAALLIDGEGVLHVAYYGHRVMANGTLVTTPMYARAKSSQPQGTGDWERVQVEPIASCNGTCGSDEQCVVQSSQLTCLPLDTNSSCADCTCEEACVLVDGTPACRPARPNRLDEPCGGLCDAGEACVAAAAGSTECRTESTACGTCGDAEVCVADDNDSGVCTESTPYSIVDGLPEGSGLFTSLVIHKNRPTLVFYDRLRRHLRGATANFTIDGSVTAGFAAFAVVCDGNDTGQHATLVVAPNDTLALAYQGDGGETLRYYTGADLKTGTSTELDNGVRDNRVDFVGADARIAFDTSGKAYVVYADQSQNELLLTYYAPTGWKRTTLLSEGAYGSFARIVVSGTKAYVTTYRREQDSTGRDISSLVMTTVNLATLP